MRYFDPSQWQPEIINLQFSVLVQTKLNLLMILSTLRRQHETRGSASCW